MAPNYHKNEFARIRDRVTDLGVNLPGATMGIAVPEYAPGRVDRGPEGSPRRVRRKNHRQRTRSGHPAAGRKSTGGLRPEIALAFRTPPAGDHCGLQGTKDIVSEPPGRNGSWHTFCFYTAIFSGIRVSVRMKQAIGRKELCNMVIGCFILGLLFSPACSP